MLELALICFFFALLLTEAPRTLKETMPGAFPGNVWRMPREKSPQVIPRASDAAVPRSSFPSHTGAVERVQRPDSQGSAQRAYLNLQMG